MIKSIMKKLGYMPVAEHREEMDLLKDGCENFAKDYLRAPRPAFTLGAEPICLQGGSFDRPAVLIGSKCHMHSLRINKGLVVAPWVRKVTMTSIQFEGRVSPSTRAGVWVDQDPRAISPDVQLSGGYNTAQEWHAKRFEGEPDDS